MYSENTYSSDDYTNRTNEEITQSTVLRELYMVYLKCSSEIPVMVKDKETGKQVPTGVYQFDARCALKALELLGDALGLFRNNSEQEKTESYEEMLKSFE